MKKLIVTISVCIVALTMLFSRPSGAADQEKPYSHQKYFKHYEETATCLKCHEAEARSFFDSQHYQWRGDAPGIVNAEDQQLGACHCPRMFSMSCGFWRRS